VGRCQRRPVLSREAPGSGLHPRPLPGCSAYSERHASRQRRTPSVPTATRIAIVTAAGLKMPVLVVRPIGCHAWGFGLRRSGDRYALEHARAIRGRGRPCEGRSRSEIDHENSQSRDGDRISSCHENSPVPLTRLPEVPHQDRSGSLMLLSGSHTLRRVTNSLARRMAGPRAAMTMSPPPPMHQ
jgi:hypothetical protein